MFLFVFWLINKMLALQIKTNHFCFMVKSVLTNYENCTFWYAKTI